MKHCTSIHFKNLKEHRKSSVKVKEKKIFIICISYYLTTWIFWGYSEHGLYNNIEVFSDKTITLPRVRKVT